VSLQNLCPLGFVSKKQDSRRGRTSNGKVSSWESLEKSQPIRVDSTHLGYILRGLRELVGVTVRLLSHHLGGGGQLHLSHPHFSLLGSHEVLSEAVFRHVKGKATGNCRHGCTCKLITFGDEITRSVDPEPWMSSTLALAGLLKQFPASSSSLSWDVTDCKLLGK